MVILTLTVVTRGLLGALSRIWVPVGLIMATHSTAQAQEPQSLEEFLARPECRTPQPDSSANLIEVTARTSSEFEPQFFCFALDSTTFGVNLSGQGVAVGPDSSRRSFRIPVDEGWYIEGFRYRRYKDVLYLFYQEINGEDGYGELSAFSFPSVKPLWVRGVRTTFNLAPVLLADTVAYVSSLDFVAKIQLRRGKVLWRHWLDVGGIRRGRHFRRFRGAAQDRIVGRLPRVHAPPAGEAPAGHGRGG